MFSFYNRLGLHVSAGPREVIRAVRYAQGRHEHRPVRRKLLRDVLAEHAKAQDLFYRVAVGGF